MAKASENPTRIQSVLLGQNDRYHGGGGYYPYHHPSNGHDPLKFSKDEIIGLVIALLCAAALVGIATYARAADPGQSSWIEALGGDFDSFLSGLEEHANTYLGTPYSSSGRLGGPGVGMDCSSFPAFAAYYEGGNPAAVGSGLKLAASFAGMSNAVLGAPSTLGWVRWAQSMGLPVSYFGSPSDALNRADLHKGDLLIGSTNGSFDPGVGGASSNNHAMIYWGTEENPDLIFHQTTASFAGGWQAGSQCQISSLTGQSWITHIAHIPGGSTKAPTTGYVVLHASSANEGLSSGNATYSLEGASFGVYSDEGLTNEVATLWTNADGWSDALELEQGSYVIKQTGAAPGYALSDATQTVEVAVGGPEAPAQVDVALTPQSAAPAVLARVTSSETGSAQGGAGLAGAQVVVNYFDSLDASVATWWTPKASWTLKTNELGEASMFQAASDPATYLASGSTLYYDASGSPCLPLGTYVVQQQQAPTGYDLSDTTPYTCQVTASDTGSEATGFDPVTIANAVIRGDLEFVKANQKTAERQGNIAFRITSATTGETHLAVTDENGWLSTAAEDHPHTNAPNQNDLAYAARNLVDSTQLSVQKGIYFTGRSDTVIDPADDRGALPYDTYTIEELPCQANAGIGLVTFEATIRARGTVDLGTVDSASAGQPAIRGQAQDGADGDGVIAASSEATVVDDVSYRGLELWGNYVLQATLVSAKTGEALKDGTGNPIGTLHPFSANMEAGVEEVPLSFDATGMAGEQALLYERLFALPEGLSVNMDQSLESEDVSTLKAFINDLEPIATYEKEESTNEPLRFEEPSNEALMSASSLDDASAALLTLSESQDGANASFDGAQQNRSTALTTDQGDQANPDATTDANPKNDETTTTNKETNASALAQKNDGSLEDAQPNDGSGTEPDDFSPNPEESKKDSSTTGESSDQTPGPAEQESDGAIDTTNDDPTNGDNTSQDAKAQNTESKSDTVTPHDTNEQTLETAQQPAEKTPEDTSDTDPNSSAATDPNAQAQSNNTPKTTATSPSAPTASQPDAMPQTGRTPLVLGIAILGIILGAAALLFHVRKPKKLGGSKGDVW